VTYIIAEVGSNWRTFQDCSQSISTAKAIGADAVKFQLYDHESLYGFPGEIQGALPFEWVEPLSDKAEACGIDFIVSVFNVDDVDMVAPYVDAFKIASCEFMYYDLYSAMKQHPHKIIASCGAHTRHEIKTVMGYGPPPDEPFTDEVFEANYGKYRPDVLMYCVVDYPSTRHDLRHIKSLVSAYPGTAIGYSDHSLDVFAAPLTAAEYGAQYIEKHFKLDHITDTPDSGHSLGPSDFQLMVKALRGAELYDMHAFQNDAALRHKRRVKAVKEIKSGDTLKFGDNVGFVRSKVDDAVGGSYMAITHIVGKSAVKDYAPGDPINPGDYRNG
jgi:sialic acid synthase SpsE